MSTPSTTGIALQLYTVRQQTAHDMIGTLQQLARMGYRAVELAGYGNATPAAIRATLNTLGMRAISAHISFDRFAAERDQVLEELRLLGCEYVVIPWLAPERRQPSALPDVTARFNEWGQACRDAGVRFGYHNHDFEFEPIAPNLTLFDALARDTDPALVHLEIDVYWAVVAGVDPVALVRQHAGRVPLLHCKDRAPGEERRDAPVGEGTLDWPRILAAAREAGTKWLIVEQDDPRDPLADVERSLRNLERMVG
jgi:sugar phosphate isomerase/epimerase